MQTVADVVLSEAGRERRRRVRHRRWLRWGLFAVFVAAAIWQPLYAFMLVDIPSELPLYSSYYWEPFAFAASTLGALLALYGLALALAQNKQVVLYLRHFRVQRAAQNMQSVLRTRFNSQCRLVTLDDATFRAVDVGRGYKAGRLLPVLGIILLVGVFLGVLILSAAKFAPTMNAKDFIWLAIGMSVFLLLPLIVGGSWFFLLLVVALSMHFWRTKKRSRVSIHDSTTLDLALTRVISLSNPGRRPVFVAPQATVVKVTDELWKTAVERFTSVVDAVIIDVTTVTENVLWELDFLKNRCPALPIIYIADAERRPSAEPQPALPGNPEVVLYTCNRSGIRKLRMNLRNFLDNAWQPSPIRSRLRSKDFRRGAVIATLYFVVLSIASWGISGGLNVLQNKLGGKGKAQIQNGSSSHKK